MTSRHMLHSASGGRSANGTGAVSRPAMLKSSSSSGILPFELLGRTISPPLQILQIEGSIQHDVTGTWAPVFKYERLVYIHGSKTLSGSLKACFDTFQREKEATSE